MPSRTPNGIIVPEKKVKSKFTIVCDSREQVPYRFDSIRANAAEGGGLIEVPVMRLGLPVGDYMCFGLPQCIIERKSVDDLYASVARRDNFVGRLERMSDLRFAAVLVEADRVDLVRNPPPFTKYSPKALSRTLWAWQVRYPVRWVFMPGREAAEQACYRLLAACWEEYRDEVMAGARDGATGNTTTDDTHRR